CLKISVVVDHSAQLVGIADTLDDLPFGQFHRLLDLAFSIFAWNKRRSPGRSTTRQLGSAIISPICGLKTQVQQFKKDVSNSAAQDLIMNVHNKTQFTQARINFVPKDSSCDTLLPKILKLAILASNASSSSIKVFECPHTKNDSISTYKGLPIFSNPHLFQLTQDKKVLKHVKNEESSRPTSNFLELKPFESSSGSLDVVNRDHRYTRRSTLWLISSPS
ncbi:hypothetical protein H5410_003707, partial [Solanum commersonii]